MTQPVFRRRITAWMRERPAPIPSIWNAIDGLHYAADIVITLIENAHIGAFDSVASDIGGRDSVANTHFFRSFYRSLRRAHWYL